MIKQASFRFHGALNDFLPARHREKQITYPFNGAPAVKDAIEALGVPHPEVDVILVNNKSCQFDYLLQSKDWVEVHPANHSIAWPAGYSIQATLPVYEKFILDVHLGTLAKTLRLLGFDTRYQNNYEDRTIVQLAAAENRIILTRDIGLLKYKKVQLGYWLRSQHHNLQLTEVLTYFKLLNQLNPFTRCLVCNGFLLAVPKQAVLDKLPPKTKIYFQEFYQCQTCERVFWKGSHYERMQEFIQPLLKLK